MTKKQFYQPEQLLASTNNRSFILRLWRVDRSKAADWRASLENLETGGRIGFTSLEQLFAYLIDLTEKNGEDQQTMKKGEQDGDE